MAVPRKYHDSDLVKRRLRALLGTFAIAMTSLKDMTCTAVMIMMMNRWPAPRAQKKHAIMTSVHTVRVMKFAFFFSYSFCSGASEACVCQHRQLKAGRREGEERGLSALEGLRRRSSQDCWAHVRLSRTWTARVVALCHCWRSGPGAGT
jgi:hypothetical protein